MKKKFIICCLATVVALGLAGCTQNDGDGSGADEEIIGEGRDIGDADEAGVLAHLGVERDRKSVV